MRSPLVGETLLWFSIRWSKSYFEPDPSLYSNDGAGGANGDFNNSLSLLSSLTSKPLAHLMVNSFIMYGSVWPHEESVVMLGSELLSSLTRPKRCLPHGRLLVRDASLFLWLLYHLKLFIKLHVSSCHSLLSSLTLSLLFSHSYSLSFILTLSLSLALFHSLYHYYFLISHICLKGWIGLF